MEGEPIDETVNEKYAYGTSLMHDLMNSGIVIDKRMYFMKCVINRSQVDNTKTRKDQVYTYTTLDPHEFTSPETSKLPLDPVVALFVRDTHTSWMKDTQTSETVAKNVARVRVDVSGTTMSVNNTLQLSDDSLILPFFIKNTDNAQEMAVYDRETGQTLFTKTQLKAMCNAPVEIKDSDGAPWFT